MTNRYFNNTLDLIGGTKARASDVEDNFNAVDDGFDVVQAEMDLKAPLASPDFSGVPTAPTAPNGTSNYQIATTQFVSNQAFTSVLPGQGGNAGKVLSTNGTAASWEVNAPAWGNVTGKPTTLAGYSIDPAAARTELGATTVGNAVFTAANAAAGRTALGASTVGANVFTAADALAARTALGGGLIGQDVFTSATAAAARATLGAASAGPIGTSGITGAASSGLGTFYKPDTMSVAFTKTGSGAASVKAGVVVDVLGTEVRFTVATAIAMPALTAGTDYAIYACQDGTARADVSFTAPTGYTVANSRLIGGFHYGLVAPGTTLVGGGFNTAGSVVTGGMLWTQPDVDLIAGINAYSLWDLKWRANTSDLRAQRGFALTDAGVWVAIYYAGINTDVDGLSRNNVAVASGTVLPRIPAGMGGNGTLTYNSYNWWQASEHALAYGARLLSEAEACMAFFGVTENQSLGGAASTIPLTARAAGYTSKYGVEQATGHHWVWGDDSAGAIATAWTANGGRGQSYNNTNIKLLLSGSRGNAALSGSRASLWSDGPTASGWSLGLRAACDHLMLV